MIKKLNFLLIVILLLSACTNKKDEVQPQEFIPKTEITGEPVRVGDITNTAMPGEPGFETEILPDKAHRPETPPPAAPETASLEALYHQISIGDSIAETNIKTNSEAKSSADGVYQYTSSDGKNVNVFVDAEHRVIKKSIDSKDLKTSKVYPVSTELANKIVNGMDIAQVEEIMGGSGIEFDDGEIMSGARVFLTGYRWYGEDDSYIVVYIERSLGVISATYSRS